MVTLIKCFCKASDHYHLWEIDYPINTWHFGELHMRGITRCSCLILLYHILQFLGGLKSSCNVPGTDGDPARHQIIITHSFCPTVNISLKFHTLNFHLTLSYSANQPTKRQINAGYHVTSLVARMTCAGQHPVFGMIMWPYAGHSPRGSNEWLVEGRIVEVNLCEHNAKILMWRQWFENRN